MRNNVQPSSAPRSRADHAAADARPDAHLMRVDAPQVSEQAAMAAYRETYNAERTHTIRLLDAPGATLTVHCPDWCTGDHAEDVTHGTYMVDLAHRGYEEALHVDLGDGGTEDVLITEITQYPFGRDMRQPTAVLWPTLGLSEGHLDPDQMCALAEQLHAYADALIELSVELADARRTARRGDR